MSESWTVGNVNKKNHRLFAHGSFNDNNCTDNTVSGNLVGERSDCMIYRPGNWQLATGRSMRPEAFGKKRVPDGFQ